MQKNYNFTQQLLVYTLIISLLLPSCNNVYNVPLEKHPPIRVHQQPSKHIAIESIINQSFAVSGDHIVTFYQQAEQVVAEVGINSPEVMGLEQEEQKKEIKVTVPTNEYPDRMYSGKQGQLGVVERKKEEKEKGREAQGPQEIEEQTKSSSMAKRQRLLTSEESTGEEATDLGNFSILPIELLQQIFCEITYPYILDCVAVNHFFYEMITSYAQVGLVGVANKPKSMFYSPRWGNDTAIDFKKDKFKILMPETVPSFFFYRVMKEVKNLSQQFWRYLEDTNIQVLDLGNNKIGDESLTQLASYLLGTHIRVLILQRNNIRKEGITQLARHLLGTDIQVLALGRNEIRDEGTAQLAKHLLGTNIQVLDLSGNNIGSEGAIQLFSYLSGTNIQVLDLWNNAIGSEGVAQLAECLQETNIRKLYLGYNRIESGTEGFLKKKYPHIEWIF